MLIDTFVNAIFLYDDKMLLTFNFKDGTKTITFADVNTALERADSGSDLDCSGAPDIKSGSVLLFRSLIRICFLGIFSYSAAASGAGLSEKTLTAPSAVRLLYSSSSRALVRQKIPPSSGIFPSASVVKLT